MHNSPETTAIRQRMQEVRRDLDEDVQEIVEGARDMCQWRTYVRSYPWICLGTALAIGYWIVPRRLSRMQPDAQTLAQMANQSGFLPASPAKSAARDIVRALVGNLVIRGVSSFVEQQVGKLFDSQPAKPQQDDQP